MCDTEAVKPSDRASARASDEVEPAQRLALWERLVNAPLIWGIWVYRITLSPLVGRSCRFTPTCSQYGLEALREHGPIHGLRLTIWRLARCQPLAKGGYDPVPIRGARCDGHDPVGGRGADAGGTQPGANRPGRPDLMDDAPMMH